MRKRFDQSVTHLGITGSQWGVVVVVAGHEGATQRVIAELLDMTEAAAGRLIDRLCGDGLLERKPRAEDRRAYSVHLTEAGHALLQSLGEAAIESEKRAFVGMSDGQLAELGDLLSHIYRNLGLEKSRFPNP